MNATRTHFILVLIFNSELLFYDILEFLWKSMIIKKWTLINIFNVALRIVSRNVMLIRRQNSLYRTSYLNEGSKDDLG